MLQRLRRDLERFHDLFGGGRCQGWQLEELIVAAIQSDTQAHHAVVWQEAGHDDMADLRVRTNEDTHLLQIKSGRATRGNLTLSGHRLGRFSGDLSAISDYLNSRSANIFSVPYSREDDESGRRHIYQACYIDVELLQGLTADWSRRGAQWVQTNEFGVEFSLRPSMSWQIWWSIPLRLAECTQPMEIG